MISGLGYVGEGRQDSVARGLLVAGAIALGLAAGVAPAWASAPRSGAAKRPAPLQAFVLASAPDSLADLQAHGRALGVVYPTYFECESPSGQITGEDTGAITAYANAQQIAVMPRFNCQDGPTVHRILTEPHARARAVAGLVQIASNPAYAGVNLDLENDLAADRSALTSFVSTLAHELHARAKKLTVDVDGVTHEDPAASIGFYDDRALAAAADYVFVIAWGTHWEGSAAGPIAPLPYVAAVARFLASLPHANRFVLGAPMYGLDWPIPAGADRHPHADALQYANVQTLIGSISATPVLDGAVDEMTFGYTRVGVQHRVWYMNARAVADRLRIGRERGLAVGVWRLGGEDQSLWSSAPVIEGQRTSGCAEPETGCSAQ